MLNRLLLLTAASALALPGQVSDRAKRLHEEALVMDGHVHVINRQFYEHSDIATRYDKTALSFASFLDLASIRLWLKSFVNRT